MVFHATTMATVQPLNIFFWPVKKQWDWDHPPYWGQFTQIFLAEGATTSHHGEKYGGFLSHRGIPSYHPNFSRVFH